MAGRTRPWVPAGGVGARRPKEVGGHIRNGTDETVAVAHFDATLVPSDSEREPIEREVVYELREPLESGEVQHAPYGRQLIDAFPDVDVDTWVEDELELEVTALEGPSGELLWDRRGEDLESLEERLDEIRRKLQTLEDRIAGLESRLGELPAETGACE